MTGKHVQPVPEGQAQPRRSGLAVGLTVLTALLCIAVLFLSARRHRDQVIRAQIEERLASFEGYLAAGEPLPIDPADLETVPLDPPRTVGPVSLRPPSDAWQLGARVVELAGMRYVVDSIANAELRAEFLQPLDAPWQAGLVEAIRQSPFLQAPERGTDRALVEHLFSAGVGVVRDDVARPRQPVSVAQSAFELLRVRCESRQLGRGNWHAPRPVSLPNFSGWIDPATEERPIVSVLILQGGNVIAEVIISRTDGRLDAESLAALNARWWTMLVGVQGPASAGAGGARN